MTEAPAPQVMANDAPETSTRKIPTQARRDTASPPYIPDHELLRCIGSGSYGEVWLARSVIGTYRAAKVVYRSTFANERPYEREFSGLKKFEPVSRSHEGLVDLLQVGRNEQAGYYYYVMELGDDQLLGPRVIPESYDPKTLGKEVSRQGKLPFDQCLKISISLAAGLSHLHKHGLIHRDIKPSNIIFVNDVPKIADIGLVAEMGESGSFVGTEGFIPPEGPGTEQGDIFSLGKVLYEISTGKDRKQYPELPTQLAESAEQKSFLELNEVILKACEGDPRKRYQSAEDMRADLMLLQAGKSVKRLRLLERRFALLTRIGVLITVLGIATGGLYWQAKKAAKRTTQALAGSFIAYGTRSVDDGDLIGSLPWFAEALLLEKGDWEREKRHRLHLSFASRQCPKIVGMWFQKGMIYDVEFSRDGRFFLTAGANREAMLWTLDNTNETPVLALTGHTEEVQSASFSPDGRWIVTASIDRTVRLWEAKTGRLAFSLPHPSKVYWANFDSSGGRLVTACGDKMSKDNRARVWDVATGKLLSDFAHHENIIGHAAFSPDGKKIITASNDGTAQVWDLQSQKPVGEPLHHDSWVYQANFSGDGRFAVTACFENYARIWNLETGTHITLPHGAAVRSAEFSPNGRLVVTACWDYTVRVWEAMTGKEAEPPLKHNSEVWHAAFSPEGRRILTVTKNGAITLWDLSSSKWFPPAEHRFYSENGSSMATIRNDYVQVWKDSQTNLVSIPVARESTPQEIVFTRDGERLLIVSSQNLAPGLKRTAAQIWGTRTGKPLSNLLLAQDGLIEPVLSEDGKNIAALAGQIVQIWDLETGRLNHELSHTNRVNQASLDPSSRLVATASDSDVHVWNIRTGQKLHVLRHSSRVNHMDFDATGRYLLASCRDDTLTALYAQIWDLQTGNPFGNPLEHNDGVLRARFSPDGKRVVTASEDRTAQIWDSATGRRLRPRLVHKDQVHDACFNADGRQVLTACLDGTLRLWDAKTGEPLTPPLRNPWPRRVVIECQFLFNGQSIVAKRSGESRIWPLNPDLARPVEDFLLLAQLLSAHQSDPTGGALPLTKENLSEAWWKLRTQYPGDFSSSPDDVQFWNEHELEANQEWHSQEATVCESKNQWFAAVFHLERLMQIEHSNQDILKRLDSARAQLTR